MTRVENGGGGNGDGRLRRAAERAVDSTWMTLVARGSAIMAAPLVGLLGGLIGYIYLGDQARSTKEMDAHADTLGRHTRLIYRTSIALGEAVTRLEALKENDARQDAEIRNLRPDWRRGP
jgi:hypothetical protein